MSIVYLLFNTIFVRTVSARRAIFGLSIIIFISLYLLHLYLDSKAPLNSKIKSVDLLAYAFSAVFFLYEVRLSLGREKWRSYIIFGFIAATLTAYSSIPALIVYFSNDKLLAGTVYETILTLTIFVFAFVKILLADTLTDAGESPFITKLKVAAANLEANFNNTTNNPEETEGEYVPENQISILDASTNENSADVSEESISAEASTDTEEPLQ